MLSSPQYIEVTALFSRQTLPRRLCSYLKKPIHYAIHKEINHRNNNCFVQKNRVFSCEI